MSAAQFWDQRYACEHLVYGDLPNDFLLEQEHKLAPGANVLCLAEGEGRNAVYLAKRGCNVTAVDISAVALQKAEKLAQQHQVRLNLIQADLASFELGQQQWHGIVAIFMHLPPALRQRIFAQIAAALKPGGIFIGEFYRPEQLKYGSGGPGDINMLYSTSLLASELTGLQIPYLLATERHVLEGVGHTGLAAVSQVVALKSK
ncbi:MAG: class I SAM-dependent methyltransferase [Chromatiaceae bacterium]|nr:class I SAM-dependent methyltransferase [Chromatiaceae bacterium]